MSQSAQSFQSSRPSQSPAEITGTSPSPQPAPAQTRHSHTLPLKDVTVNDAFWGEEQELVRTAVIPYQWRALNDQVPGAAPSYCMHNFKAAAAPVTLEMADGLPWRGDGIR